MRQLKISKSITSRDSHALDRYLKEIGKVELLSPEEEVSLALLIKNGDAIALEKLTKANLRFVVSVAKQYQNQGLALGDLINEGNLGLIKAAEKFDPGKGFKFISYAVWWIRQSILQALAEQSRIVRLPMNRLNEIGKINKAFLALEQKFEREPSSEELAEVLNIDSDYLTFNGHAQGNAVSIDQPLNDSSNERLIDRLASIKNNPDDSLLKDGLKREIQRALSTLTAREADVLSMSFGLNNWEPMEPEIIAEKFGLSKERIRQIKLNAIKRLKETTRNNLLKSYLG
ncbi:MAG: sigma-70 family RNA polymerase sigma factor [Cyclobacteriaceae bacterium]